MPDRTQGKPLPGSTHRRHDDHVDAFRARILAAALPNVAFDGWTTRLMREAADAAGLTHGEMRLAFSGGILDLVDYFLADGDRRMEEALSRRDLGALKIRERITAAVRMRIEVDLAHREAVRRAVTLLSLPLSGIAGPRALYRTVDTIWRAIGDRSTDFNFYTKRATLAGVYSAVTLYWFADQSEDFANTWAFLDKRIEDVMQIEKAKASLRKAGEWLPDPLGVIGRLRYGRG
ncbi:MAG: COQ9 family protein [Parvibaculum sp.]|uniref:COQ9 family protein n=1 Tax=Parvibaculum sp. TaxID=2024848 RepID=UPI003C755A35